MLRRSLALGAASVLAVLVACNGEEAATTTPTPVRTEGAGPRAVLVEVRDGAVVGGVRRVALAVGEQLRLTVRSDAADEVHVHGIDERAEVGAGGEVTLDLAFPAPGVFEAELEGSKVELVQLEVR